MSDAQAVRAWLARSGYPLESEVARVFRAAGFQVFQGLHYEADSPDASGAREVDVLAVQEEFVQGHPTTRCAVAFVIECKSSSAPWVVFRGHSAPSAVGAVGRVPMKGVHEHNLYAAIELNTSPWLLGVSEDAGIRLGALPTRERAPGIERTQRDQAHAAVTQVVAGAQGILRGGAPHLPTIAMPVLVLGSDLYTVAYDVEGQEVVLPSGWERILWRGDRSAEPIAIDVVSHGSLVEYARLAAQGATELLPVLRGAALEAREEAFRRQSAPSRLDTVIVGVEATSDAVARLVGRARRLRPKRD